jgi:hypothetical protein
MTLARLLPAVLLICIVPAYAQKPTDSLSGQPKATVAEKPVASDPWKFSLNRPADLQSEGPLARMRLEEFRIDPNTLSSNAETPAPRKDEEVPTETGCFKIRSYVMARDSKGSDATHLVGYTTCVPALRYGVRKVEAAPPALNR